MDIIKEEVNNLWYLLPWVSCDTIEQYLRNVPNSRSEQRSALCLQHFYKQKDNDNETFRREVEEDALKIMVVLRDVSYSDIKKKLLLFGTIKGRREAVVREILNEKYNSDLSNMNLDGTPTKRKCENDSNSQDETIKIKIRRKDRSLEVVSTIDRRRNSVGGNDQVTQQQPQQQSHTLPFSASSGNTEPRGAAVPSPPSSPTTTSSSSSTTLNPRSRSLSPVFDPEGLFNEYRDNNNSGREERQQKERREYLDVPQIPRVSQSLTSKISMPSTSRYLSYLQDSPSYSSDTSDTFNLVTYLQYSTRASGKRIRQIVDRLGLDVTKKPNSADMQVLLKYLSHKKVISVSDTESSSRSTTDSENDVDLNRTFISGIHRYVGNDASRRKKMPEASITSKTKVPEATIVREVPEQAPRDPQVLVLPPLTGETKRRSPRRHNASVFDAIDLSSPVIGDNQQQPFNLGPLAAVTEEPKENDLGATAHGKPADVLELPSLPVETKRRSPRKRNILEINPIDFLSPVTRDNQQQRPNLGLVEAVTIPREHNKGATAHSDPADDLNRTYLLEVNRSVGNEAAVRRKKVPEATITSKTKVAEATIVTEVPEQASEVPQDIQPSTSNAEVTNWLETAGPCTGRKRNIDDKLVYRLIEMFPDACPDYVRSLCEDKVLNDLNFIATEYMLGTDYPKRAEKPASPQKELDPDEQFENLKEIFPDADPTYLRRKCDEVAGDMDAMKQFIAEAFEKKNYPTMKEYLRKQQLSSQQRQYTSQFKVEDFVQLFPDPEATFNDPNRTVKMDAESRHYVNVYMRNKYNMIGVRHVDSIVVWMTDVKSCIKALDNHLKTGQPRLKQRRKMCFLPDNMQNIPLLQELAFYTHEEEIKAYIAEKAQREKDAKQDAIANGLIETCGCCFDDEIMLRDTFTCENGCKFCRDCIKRSVEVAMGEGKYDIKCLGECEAIFGLHTLQEVLPPKVFSKLAQKQAVAEVKAAGIEELENCPFCDFATIPAPEDKLFRCLNPDCMKESCRRCKEPSHVPLKCEEVEVDEAVKARTYIEDKLTDALLRKCWSCGTKFFKEEGCNKMTCSCGAKMCYLCRQPVKDYKHFNGLGGDQTHLCPLYSDNISVNEESVLRAAQAAKAEVDVSKLKHDPTADLKKHFKERKKVVRQPHLNVWQQAQQQMQADAQHMQAHAQRMQAQAQQVRVQAQAQQVRVHVQQVIRGVAADALPHHPPNPQLAYPVPPIPPQRPERVHAARQNVAAYDAFPLPPQAPRAQQLPQVYNVLTVPDVRPLAAEPPEAARRDPIVEEFGNVAHVLDGLDDRIDEALIRLHEQMNWDDLNL